MNSVVEVEVRYLPYCSEADGSTAWWAHEVRRDRWTWEAVEGSHHRPVHTYRGDRDGGSLDDRASCKATSSGIRPAAEEGNRRT